MQNWVKKNIALFIYQHLIRGMIHPAKPPCWELSLSMRAAEIQEGSLLQAAVELRAGALCLPLSRGCASFALWIEPLIHGKLKCDKCLTFFHLFLFLDFLQLDHSWISFLIQSCSQAPPHPCCLLSRFILFIPSLCSIHTQGCNPIRIPLLRSLWLWWFTHSSPEELLGRGSQGSSSPLPWAGGASGHLTLLWMTRRGEKWGWSRGQDWKSLLEKLI